MSDGVTMQVQIRSGQVRSTPSFMGRVLAEVEYGEALTVYEEQAGWRRVALERPAGVSGWLHQSALTSRKLVLNPDDEVVRQAADSDEIALAGKGFSAEVEEEYRRQHRELDFSWLDRLEARRTAPAAVRDFLRQGGLPLQGGEQ